MFNKFFAVAAIMILAAMAVACATPTAAPTSAPAVTKIVETKVVEQTKVVEKVITATPAPQTPVAKPGSIVINGAGASFPYPLYSRWFFEYAYVNPAVRINYNPIGSGGGISQITAKTVDFGGSDAPMTDAEYAKAPGVQMFPIVAGPVVPVYNIKDDAGAMITETLKFPASTARSICCSPRTTWNASAIASPTSASASSTRRPGGWKS